MMSFFKKTQLAILLCISNAAFCGAMANMVEMTSDYDGLYIGLDVTVGDFNATITSSYPYGYIDLSDINIAGGGMIGYDFTIYDRFKLGLEFLGNANAYTASVERFRENTTLSAEQRYNLAGRILPGFLFYPGVVGHMILGYSNAYTTLKDNGQDGFINKSGNQSGFQGGLGMKVELPAGFTFRGDIVYSIYGTLSGNGGTNNNLYEFQHYSVAPSVLEGTLSIIYKPNISF
ncbi:MAG: outer membrane beta-barrel protein [Legionellales bacterium]|nr:outer membrane beta-barrel protein [Legionellales bacterium]